MKGITFLITGILIGALDWSVYSGWLWIFEHDSCIISGMKQICWSASPYPSMVITGMAICLSLMWGWLVFERVVDILADWGI
jgi:hypothetical protein